MDKLTDKKETYVFDYLDELLDSAHWSRRMVVLSAVRAQFFCYNVTMLRDTLIELANKALVEKYVRCDIDVRPVVDNILEEYEPELDKNGITAFGTKRLSKAQ